MFLLCPEQSASGVGGVRRVLISAEYRPVPVDERDEGKSRTALIE